MPKDLEFNKYSRATTDETERLLRLAGMSTACAFDDEEGYQSWLGMPEEQGPLKSPFKTGALIPVKAGF